MKRIAIVILLLAILGSCASVKPQTQIPEFSTEVIQVYTDNYISDTTTVRDYYYPSEPVPATVYLHDFENCLVPNDKAYVLRRSSDIFLGLFIGVAASVWVFMF